LSRLSCCRRSRILLTQIASCGPTCLESRGLASAATFLQRWPSFLVVGADNLFASKYSLCTSSAVYFANQVFVALGGVALWPRASLRTRCRGCPGFVWNWRPPESDAKVALWRKRLVKSSHADVSGEATRPRIMIVTGARLARNFDHLEFVEPAPSFSKSSFIRPCVRRWVPTRRSIAGLRRFCGVILPRLPPAPIMVCALIDEQMSAVVEALTS